MGVLTEMKLGVLPYSDGSGHAVDISWREQDHPESGEVYISTPGFPAEDIDKVIEALKLVRDTLKQDAP